LIVVDASALADALIDDGDAGKAARAALTDDEHWAAPDHLIVEVVSVVRGRHLAGKVGDERAAQAIAALAELVIDTVDLVPLLDRVWQLRDNLSAYDAAYVAVAEVLGCPLVTADRRLASSIGPRCDIVLLDGSRR
jgi:predicted nucleic acid-binding protein